MLFHKLPPRHWLNNKPIALFFYILIVLFVISQFNVTGQFNIAFGILGKSEVHKRVLVITVAMESQNMGCSIQQITSRFGLGLGMGAWCDIQDVIRVKLGYDLGLLNRAQNKDNFNYKESGFAISVGYLF